MMYDEVQPKPEDVPKALDQYVAAVRSCYGYRLHDIVLFGSRARGDMRSDSDADVAVVIADGDWSFWREKRELADLTYEPLIDWGLSIQPWPLSISQWANPELHHNPRFVHAIKRDAKPLAENE